MAMPKAHFKPQLVAGKNDFHLLQGASLVFDLAHQLQIANPLITFSMVLLSSIVFALAGFINAVFAKKFDDISIVPTFVLTPLTYLGGVFYSISLLPEFWQNVSKANPILYMVNAFRYGILGTSDISIAHAYTILLVFVVGLFSACMFLMQRGIGIRE